MADDLVNHGTCAMSNENEDAGRNQRPRQSNKRCKMSTSKSALAQVKTQPLVEVTPESLRQHRDNLANDPNYRSAERGRSREISDHYAEIRREGDEAAKAERPDESRLRGEVRLEKAKDRQSRSGADLDAFTISKTIDTMLAAADTPAKRKQLISLLKSAAGRLERNYGPAEHVAVTYNLRKSVRLVLARRDENDENDAAMTLAFLSVLIDLQAEISFHRNTIGNERHLTEVIGVPGIRLALNVVGQAEISERIVSRAAEYENLYRGTIVDAHEDGSEARWPRLLTGAEIGRRLNITCREAESLRTGGKPLRGIRPVDRDANPRRAHRKTVRAIPTPEQAAILAENEALALHFDRTMRTVRSWSPERRGVMIAKMASDMSQRGENRTSAPIDTIRADLTEICHAPESTAISAGYVASSDDLELLDRHGVTPSNVRQMRRRGKLKGRIQALREREVEKARQAALPVADDGELPF